MEDKNLKKGVYLISGEASAAHKKGKISVIGKELEKGEHISIPHGKTIPIEAVTDAEISLDISDPSKFQALPERTIPPAWDELVARMKKDNSRSVLVLGEMDTGKTFFTTYIANRLIGLGKKVSALDLDAGQSDIGPPGTLGLALLEKPEVFLTGIEPVEIYYMGSHSPGLHFLPALTGFYKMTKKALSISDILIIDTPGWVQGDGGRALRRAEIEMLEPDVVVLMQRGDELEHLVRNYDQSKVARLTVSKKASFTSADDRKKLRELISKKYFKGSREYVIPFSQINTDRCYLLSGTKVNIDDSVKGKLLRVEKLSSWEGYLAVTESEMTAADTEELKKALNTKFKIKNIVAGEEYGVEVALCDRNARALGLAVIKKIDYEGEKITVYTPVKPEDVKKTGIIQFGSLRVEPDGSEAGFVIPGYF